MIKPIKQLAGCVIYDEEGRILLLHRNKNGLVQWELPGGKVEDDETVSQAALRELREELDLRVEIITQLGSARFQMYDVDWNYTWFEARITDGQMPEICEPQNFDVLQHWQIKDLRKRTDLSQNVMNLLKVL